VMRHGDPAYPYGRPFFGAYCPPPLAPPRRRPMLPDVAAQADLGDAAPYLEAYSQLSPPDAVALSEPLTSLRMRSGGLTLTRGSHGSSFLERSRPLVPVGTTQSRSGGR
jgi:hypothetical protein